MKKITFSIIASLSFLYGSAQYEPDVKYLQEMIWQQVMPHDSLVWSSDSGANFIAEDVVEMRLFPDGLIKELSAYDPNLYYTFSGVNNGNLTEVFGIEPISLDTSSRYEFYKNVMGQDSILKSYYDDGSGNLEFEIAFELFYNTAGKTSSFKIYVDILGTGTLTEVNEYVFHYNTSSRLDSVTINTLFPGGMEGKMEHTYDSSDRLIQWDFYEVDGNDELIPSERYFFEHNAQGQIREVIELYYDEDSTTFILSSSWKYYVRQNSGISVKEESKLELKELLIYPNPAKDVISIISELEFTEYSIMSLTGQAVKEGAFSETIQVEDLNKGIYLISLKSKEGTEIKKFQKL